MSLLSRYRGGAHDEVYRLLLEDPEHDEALPVARELMWRVRKNLEVLAGRWREHGFTLKQPLGAPGSAKAALRELEEALGPLPATLHAFYEEIGWINFIEAPPNDDWPDREELDPVAVDEL